MAAVRVLVVDDSGVARRLIAGVLASEPGFVVEAVERGVDALALLAEFQPDAVILDVEMPELDGLATLQRIKQLQPALPVIMCSTASQRSGQVTREALAAGAADSVTKPSGAGGLDAARAQLRSDLLAKIEAVVPRSADELPGLEPHAEGTADPAPAATDVTVGACAAVVIGVSTGGPQALAEVIPALPASLPVPVLVVQHMPTAFTRLLADRLDAKAAVRVVEAEDRMQVERGTVYIAPGDFHMRVVRRGASVRIALDQEPPENSCRPAADPLFRSAADVWGSALLAVVLTGMGNDGASGAVRVVERGGRVIVQDEATSVVWGMPAAVVRAGLAERVVPLGAVKDQIVRAATLRRSRIGV